MEEKGTCGDGAEEGEDGWEFWGRVYDDRALRAEISSGSTQEPTLSELLSGEELQKTRVMIQNLPTPLNEVEIKEMLEARLGPTTVMKVYLMRATAAMAEFYYASDAAAAAAALDGAEVGGRRLSVRASGPRFAPLPTMEERGLGWGEALRAKDEERAELGLSMGTLVPQMVALLKRKGPMRLSDERIAGLVRDEGSESLRAHVGAWPQGAMRARAELAVVGPLLTLPGGRNEDIATLLCARVGGEAEGGWWKEPWEPFPVSHVRSLASLLEYLAALVSHFGPLWTGDARVGVVLMAWTPAYELGLGTLMELGAEWGLVRADDVFYNLWDPAQRATLADATTPISRPKAAKPKSVALKPVAAQKSAPPLGALKPSLNSIVSSRLFV